MPEVPTTNLNALYANTAPGNVIKSAVIDPALQDMVQAINDNFAEFQALKLALELPIPDQSIVTRHLRNLAVTTPKLAQFAVTADKIADGSITLAKLADLVVTAAKIANGTITESKMANLSVSRRTIIPGSVGANEIDPTILKPISDATVNVRLNQIDEQLIDVGKNVRAVGAGMGGNDTATIQSIMNMKGSIIIPDGEYLVDPLYVKSDTIIIFGPNARLKARSGYTTNDCLLNIKGVSNVTIYGNHANVELLKDEYVSGEWRHGVMIMDSDYVSIYDLHSNNSGGDGFYIGGNVRGYSQYIRIQNCYADNNRRQGLSIVSGKDITIDGGSYTNTTGTAPAAGIDIEPNFSTDFLENIIVRGVKTKGNDGSSVMVVPGNTHNPVSISIIDCESVEDCKNTNSLGAFYMSNSPIQKVEGTIFLQNNRVFNCYHAGIGFSRWNELAPKVNVDGMHMVDVASKTGTFERFRVGVSMTIEATDVGTWFGNIDLKDCEIIDTRATPLIYMPFYFFNYGTKDFRNIKITNPKANNWITNPLGSPVLFNTKTLNCVVNYENGLDLKDLGSRNVQQFYYGATISNGSVNTAPKYTLPSASTCVGMEISFRVDFDGAVWIQPAATDLIRHYSNGINGGLTAWKKGSYIKLKAIAATEWQVIESAGGWAPHPFRESPLPTMYEGSAPTTGTWALGTKVDNLAPSRTKNISHWKNVTAGTPGIWMAYGTGWGTTAERPALVSGDSGYSYFDTTLAKIIIWNGSTWLI